MLPSFIELVETFHIFCISETKLDQDDAISCSGYTSYNQRRRQRDISKSGGLGFFVRDTLVYFVKIIDSASDYLIDKNFRKGSQPGP